MVTRDRAISTVMDVALALLIVSACVVMIGAYLQTDPDPIADDRGDRAIQTLSGTTVTITYDVRSENETGHAATDSDHYDHPDDPDSDDVGEQYETTTYGSTLDLLGEAALTNLRVSGTELFTYGYDVERSVEGAIQGRLVGTEGRTYAVATWQPYDGAGIDGTATAGNRPPRTADVSSATTTVSSGLPSVDPETLTESFLEGEDGTASRSGIDDGFDVVAEDIAGVLIEGYFPPTRTQYALESTRTENAIAVYDYRRMADAAGVDLEDRITGTTPDATEANAVLRGDAGDDDGLAAVIAADLRDSPAGEELRATYDEYGENPPPHEEDERERDLEETFEAVVSMETVDVTVQTWDP